jgi:TetR/AcrR family transcriptional regulator, cholesterol catabolism regulator
MATRSNKQSAKQPVKRAPPPERPRRTAIQSLREDVLSLKRERILQEAAALFYERGYMQTTMDAIAERMGATKPFVYYHFQSKVEMLVEICERATGDALTAADAALSVDGTPLQKFEGFVREFTRAALKYHEFVAVYFREEFNLPEQATERINLMRKTINHKLRNLLAEGKASGDFGIDDPGVTALVIAGMSSYAFAWYRDTGRLGAENVTDLIVKMALKLVAVPASEAA